MTNITVPSEPGREPAQIPNTFSRECKPCGTTPAMLDMVPRPQDVEGNRTWLGCGDCHQFIGWANKAESGAETKTCRSSEFPSGVRNSILKRDNYTCQACGRSAPNVVLHLDHIIPAKEGGLSREDNGITLCQECNLGKKDGHTVLDAFRLWIKTVRKGARSCQ